MRKNKFEISFSSNIYKVKEIVSFSLSFISENLPKLTADELGDLKLMLCELLFNAVIHGNKQDAEKNVSMSIEIKDNAVYTIISDEGAGFDYMKLIKDINESDDIFKESGRGIKLVMSLADQVSFNPDGSAIRFCKRAADNG